MSWGGLTGAWPQPVEIVPDPPLPYLQVSGASHLLELDLDHGCELVPPSLQPRFELVLPIGA